MADFGINDDYAYLKGGKYEFYFGYEYTVPSNPEEDEDYEWAFVVKVNGEIEEVMSQSQVVEAAGLEKYHWQYNQHNVEDILLAGIGLFLDNERKTEKNG